MNTNEILLCSLKGYLATKGFEEKKVITNRFSLWYHLTHELEVMLPADELVNHEQTDEILDEAILKLSCAYNLNFDSLKNILLHDDSDLLQVRSSGVSVSHGSINFDEGLKALIGLYGIIKATANRNIKAKGKRKAVEQYLSGVNMLAPKAGSFIYSVEIQLLDVEDDYNDPNYRIESDVSLSRYVNSNLAILLARVSEKIKKADYESPAKLLSIGVDSSFCNNFLNLFSKNSEQLEFDFDWSFREGVSNNTPSKVVFNSKDRVEIEKFRELLSKSKVKKYIDIPAYIEKYSWPIDEERGRVYLRLFIDNKDYACFIETESELYEKLKAEHAKKEITVTCDLLITSGQRTSIDILKMYSIKLNQNMEIEINT